MSNENDHGRPTLVTGPQDRSEPEELAKARPGKEGEVWPPPVYRDVTGRPIPLAAGWEAPEGERPRDHAHQRWAGAAEAMKEEAASLFAADSRQTQADYRPPVSYPATAGGSAFFTGARQAANDQQTGGQALRTGGQSVRTGGQAVRTGGQAVGTGGQAVGTGGQAVGTGGQSTRTGGQSTRTGGQASQPREEQPTAAPYADPAAERAEAPRRPLRDYQQNYPRTSPGGFQQPLGDDYAPFEDYQPGQTGAQPQIQGEAPGWDEPRYQQGRSATGEQPAGWQQVQPSQQLNRYAGGPAESYSENYAEQDETRRAADGRNAAQENWNTPQGGYASQDETRRAPDGWGSRQDNSSRQDETRRGPDSWNAPQDDYQSQEETRRAPDGWDSRQDSPSRQDETRRAPDGWNAPQDDYASQDETRRAPDGWDSRQDAPSRQDETRRAPDARNGQQESWNTPQGGYASQDETRRAPDGWDNPRDDYPSQDETRRAPDGWGNSSRQDEARRGPDGWDDPQDDYPSQDETRRAGEGQNAAQNYSAQDETRRAPDGWNAPQQGYPGQDETRRAPERARGWDSPGDEVPGWGPQTGPTQGGNSGGQGWAAPARQEPYQRDDYESESYSSGSNSGANPGSNAGSNAGARDQYRGPEQPRQGGFPDPEHEYDQIRQRGGRLLGGPWPDDPGYGDQNDWDNQAGYRGAHGRPPRGHGNPPRGGRNGKRRVSYRTRAGVAVLIIVALAVGRFVSQYSDDVLGQTRPFLREGTVGKPVDLRYAQVTATDAQGSACVSAGFNGTFRSPGVFVVVPVKIVPKGRAAQFQYAAIEDSEGRLYTTSTLGRSSFDMGSAQAGVARYATVMIEMPKDRVAGARLRLALNELYTKQDDMTDIDLGISQKDVDAWVKNAETITVGESSDLPPGQNQEAAAEAEAPCEGPVVPE
ncbi:hypothetical protein LWF15_27200 [Kineosporia rhizophila]|uniref:hypothetical protein n=1 Tax=Kineosporia rhizophila TaxID=84633 RepID=UPI001E5F6B47|nr:hypothetical protein [Kineosporia rhizophila]MCE0539193.1 hypothetical protein [Kineosporia rhizophila]